MSGATWEEGLPAEGFSGKDQRCMGVRQVLACPRGLVHSRPLLVLAEHLLGARHLAGCSREATVLAAQWERGAGCWRVLPRATEGK